VSNDLEGTKEGTQDFVHLNGRGRERFKIPLFLENRWLRDRDRRSSREKMERQQELDSRNKLRKGRAWQLKPERGGGR